MFELLRIPEFLDAASLVEELRAAAGTSATVYGHAERPVDTQVRRTTRVAVSPAMRDLVMTRLLATRDAIAAHFDTALGECEEPQFLRYEPGDFFVAHQDGNTPVMRDFTLARRISIVIFLNAGEYGGGSLVLHGRYPDYEARHVVEASPGMLAAFRSETTHEVTPVTDGVRFTIATWFRASPGTA